MTNIDSRLAKFARIIEHKARLSDKDTIKVKMPGDLRKSFNGYMLTEDNIAKRLNYILPDSMRVTHVRVRKCFGNEGACPHYKRILSIVAIQPS